MLLTIPAYNNEKDYEEVIYDPIRNIQQIGFMEEGTQMSVIGVVEKVNKSKKFLLKKHAKLSYIYIYKRNIYMYIEILIKGKNMER